MKLKLHRIFQNENIEDMACMIFQIMIEYGSSMSQMTIIPGEINFTTVEVLL